MLNSGLVIIGLRVDWKLVISGLIMKLIMMGLHGIVIDYDILRPDVEVDHTIEDKNHVDVDNIDYKVDHYVHISCVPSV